MRDAEKSLREQYGKQYEELVRVAKGHGLFQRDILVTQISLGCRFPTDTLNTERFRRYVCMEFVVMVNGAWFVCLVFTELVMD